MGKIKYILGVWISVLYLIVYSGIGYGQVEMVPPENDVYLFLRRMMMEGNIEGYNPSSIPVSRAEVADYLRVLKGARILEEDRRLLRDFDVEFSHELDGDLRKSVSLVNDFKFKNFFADDKQKYLYAYSDSNKSFFLDVTGNVSQRNSSGDSMRSNAITLGELGLRVRGTLFNSVGFYLRASNGLVLSGEKNDRDFAAATDPKLKGNWRFNTQGKNFDTFEGYLRYQTETRWLALTAGREALYMGNGYADRIYLSRNTVPFDFLKVDLSGGTLRYSFLYGSLKGDSLGKDIRYKNMATHKLDVLFSNKFRVGFWESVTISDNAFSFTFLNPVSFLTSADLNTGTISSDNNNALMGLDFEWIALKNLALQGTLIIDDLELSTLFTNDPRSGVNKFAYQTGLMWNNAFTVPTLTAAVEYTRIDPFVYAHATNKSQYTHWTMPLGPAMPPNSDQVALRFTYFPYNRLKLDLSYFHQRHAEGIVLDSTGKIAINYGGYLNRGGGVRGAFLDGNRINTDMVTFDAVWEPVRQYFVELRFVYKFQDLVYASRKVSDVWGFCTVRVEL